jgi:four helix bundle protein
MNSFQKITPLQTKYKFQKLEVYQLSLDYVNSIYTLSKQLPERERYNLANQMERAATSITLNIAEGSTGQSDPEQHRFLGLALRSYLETIACLDLIQNQGYITPEELEPIREQGHIIFIKLSAFRKSLNARGQN